MQTIQHLATNHAAGRRRSAFTLIEILIVVIIIGILASIVVPQFSSATNESRENSLRMNLFRVRTQLQIYRSQHNDNWPTFDDFAAQLTGQTDVDGNVGTDFGPYLGAIPLNPMTGSSTITDTLDYDPNTGDWYYNQNTGDFRSNDAAEHATL
jgi:general secretion pathway protein G